MIKNNNLENFYKNYSIDLIEHDDYNSSLISLKHGLKSYYETYNIWNADFFSYFTEANSNIYLNNTLGTEYINKYFASITFTHLAFEQIILDMLETKSNILSRFSMDKNTNLIELLTGEISETDCSKRKKIDYSIALLRIKNLILNHEKLPSKYQIDLKFHFFKDYFDTLERLRKFRNDIIHSGKIILNRYVYELFFVNEVLPLIKIYLKTQNPSNLIERNLYCKKNVIEEITKNPLSLDFNDINKYNELLKNLKRINHFKELVRASFF